MSNHYVANATDLFVDFRARVGTKKGFIGDFPVENSKVSKNPGLEQKRARLPDFQAENSKVSKNPGLEQKGVFIFGFSGRESN